VDLAVSRTLGAAPAATAVSSPDESAGITTGLNLQPGSDDDGWVIPEPAMLSDGTRVQLYKDGEALHAAYEAIRHAKRRICLEVYIFADDPTGRAFADLLSEKARQGVAVYLIYDSFGSIATDREMFRQMIRAGVRVEVFHPIRPWETRFSWRPINRDHRKLLVIDDHIAGLGGLNIGTEYAGSWVIASDKHACELWRDNGVGLVGPSARNFLHAFARSWRYVTAGGQMGKAEYIHGIDLSNITGRRLAAHAGALSRHRSRLHLPPEAPQPDVGILASTPTTSSVLRLLLHRLTSEAKNSLQLTMAYFAPDDDLIDDLCRAARRGVKVQLMLPGKGDVRALIVAARSFYEKLMSHGVEVFERQGCVLHAKTIVMDGRVSVLGSTNLDSRSIEYNCEISAIIRNKVFGAQMIRLFENDICYAKRINLKEWRRRPLGDRVVQWAVSRARYVL
jgi:cardiolipin synthase